MANNLSPVGTEVQVNLVPNQNGDQAHPEIATLTDGGFFIAFEDFDANDNIIGQFVDPDGTLSGGNIDIDVGGGNQFNPAVAARAGGGAIVVWDDVAAGNDTQYSIVSSAGVASAEQTVLGGIDPLFEPDVATLAT